MLLRLVLLSLPTGALYWLVAERELGWETMELWAIWAALLFFYALGVQASSRARGSLSVGFILITSAAFRAGSFLFERPLDLPKAGVAGADVLALLVGLALLRRAKLPLGLVLVHGWNPLVVTELGAEARLEALALLGLVSAFALLQNGQEWLAALVYGGSLGGPLPVLATIPLMGRALGFRAVVSLALGAGLWWLKGWPPALGDYTGASLAPSLVTVSRFLVTRDPSFALGVALVGFLIVAIWAAMSLKDDHSRLPEKAIVAVGAFLFLAPFVLPWWFVAIGYLAAYSRNRGWLVFTATAPLTYLAMDEGSYSFWLGFAQYFPAYASLTYVWLGRKKER
ncbi:MAG TPA: hypothetical protein VLK65_24570 [Vicinamibacteria bacterium]|nr:hypothetical protein [Vicinamibacteria bacterium]